MYGDKIKPEKFMIKNGPMNYYRQKTFVFYLLMAALLSGCSWFGGKKAMFADLYVGTNRNLVVLLPTIGGEGLHYEAQGFIKAVRERGFEGHLKILDVDPSLYLNNKIIELLKTEVIIPAKNDGYENIILVGISLGGHGALLYATKYPEDVYFVFVMAPFLAGPVVADAIEKAGGLDKFEDCPSIAWDYACNMWYLLKKYVSQPDNRRRIALGYGTEDRFARQNRLLADTLPSDLVFTVSGGHDWGTWKKLWIMALDHFQVLKSNQILPGKNISK
ncbi:MAG: alpha/beta hydrolase [Candidatus Desulfatibia sp.]|uniref:alpha/beta hydrolase-fold protein n=1 Tax=Candidatus Desulfatibia sp. TaxID=3101189 RepID=UPI002F2DA3DB